MLSFIPTNIFSQDIYICTNIHKSAKLRLFFLCHRSPCSVLGLTRDDDRVLPFLLLCGEQSERPAVYTAVRRESFHQSFSPLTARSPSAPFRAAVTAHWESPHASFEPWLAQEEKLSYRESLRDSKLSTSCLPELFKEASFASFCPSTSFRQFFSFSNKSTLLLLNLLRDSREI